MTQLYRSERGGYLTDSSARYWGARTTAILPLIHMVTAVALIQTIGFMLQIAPLLTPMVRGITCIPFLSAFVFLLADTGYADDLSERMRADSPAEAERRRLSAQRFVRGSYLMGGLTVATMLLSHAFQPST